MGVGAVVLPVVDGPVSSSQTAEFFASKATKVERSRM